jgi:hypothetical protein
MMRTTSKLLLVSWLWVSACAGRLARADECAPLSPARGPFDARPDPELVDYWTAVHKAFFDAEPLVPKVQMVLTPLTAAPEEAVYIVNLHDGDPSQPATYVAVSVRAKESIRYADKRDAVGVVVARASMDSATVAEVAELWERIVLNAQFPRQSDGKTGTSYYFSGGWVTAGGSAQTMEPKPNTCARNLIDVGRTLAAYARAGTLKQREEIRRDLLRQVRALRKRLETQKAANSS